MWEFSLLVLSLSDLITTLHSVTKEIGRESDTLVNHLYCVGGSLVSRGGQVLHCSDIMWLIEVILVLIEVFVLQEVTSNAFP